LEAVFTANQLTDTDKQNSTANTQTKYNSTKVKQNYPDSVAFYNTWPGHEMGLFYNTPEPTRGTNMLHDKIWKRI